MTKKSALCRSRPQRGQSTPETCKAERTTPKYFSAVVVLPANRLLREEEAWQILDEHLSDYMHQEKPAEEADLQ